MNRGRAFTLIELLVVIIIITLLIFLFLPAFGTLMEQGQCTKCKIHMRELVVGYGLYSVDNQGKLLYGMPVNKTAYRDVAWLPGTGTDPIKNGDLYPYANDLELHNCPSDPNGLPRSYVIVAPMYGEAWNSWINGTKNINGVSNVSGQIVIVEESDSRGWNIGSFIISVQTGSSNFIDCPAALHYDTTTDNYAFLDGHVESRTWVTRTVLDAARLGKLGVWNHYVKVSPTNADWLWFRPRFRAMPTVYNSNGSIFVPYMMLDPDA